MITKPSEARLLYFVVSIFSMGMSDLFQLVVLMGVAILYCAPEGARGSFGEGTPSKITQYILRK